ncbi:MAG: hypothetical protein R3A79_00280 [Nannocystaceae bacterium]
MSALVVLLAAALCALLWRGVTAAVRARWPQEQVPETLALDLTELVVVAGLTAAALVVGGDVILDPSRWAATGSASVQGLVSAATGYLVAHLAGVARYGGARSLLVHHVVLIVGFSFTLAVDAYHGYVLVTLIGTSTSMLRDLTGLARRGYLRLHRSAVAVLYAILEALPAIAIPLQFFAFEIPRGELSPAALWVGSIAFPTVAAIGLFSVAQVLRRLVSRRGEAPVAPPPVAAASMSDAAAGSSLSLRRIAATSGRWLAEAAASSGTWLPLDADLTAGDRRGAAESSGARPVVV